MAWRRRDQDRELNLERDGISASPVTSHKSTVFQDLGVLPSLRTVLERPFETPRNPSRPCKNSEPISNSAQSRRLEPVGKQNNRAPRHCERSEAIQGPRIGGPWIARNDGLEIGSPISGRRQSVIRSTEFRISWTVHGRSTHLGSAGREALTERQTSYILVNATRASEAAVNHPSFPRANRESARTKFSCSCPHAVPMTYES
jgi:hypothetical protein